MPTGLLQIQHRWLAGMTVAVGVLSGCTTTSEVAFVPPDPPSFVAVISPISGSYALTVEQDDILVANAVVDGTECEGYIGPVDFRAQFQRVGKAALDTVFASERTADTATADYQVVIRPWTRMARVTHLSEGFLATRRRAEVWLGADVTAIPPSGPAIQFEIPINSYVETTEKSVETSCDSGLYVYYDAMNTLMGQVYSDINNRLLSEFSSSSAL